MTLLPLLANPNLDLFLLLTGIFLIYAECNRPGNVLLGSSGTFAVLLGIYALARHPISPLALLALVAGLCLLLLALTSSRAPSIATLHRERWVRPGNYRDLALTLAATAAIVPALATLTRPAIHPLVALAAGTLFTFVTLPLARIALRARRNKRALHIPAPNLQPSARSMAE